MRKCDRDMPCVKGMSKLKCRVDGHVIKLEETCCISDDNPKLLELFPLPPISEYCENCESYKPDDDWPYEAACPDSPHGFTRNFDVCDNFSPKKSVLEEAERKRFDLRKF